MHICTFISALSANLFLYVSMSMSLSSYSSFSCNIYASLRVSALGFHSQSPGTPIDCMILPNCSRLILEWHLKFYQSVFQLSPNYIKIIPSFITESMDIKSKCRTQNCGDKLPIFIFLYCRVLLYAYIITCLSLMSIYSKIKALLLLHFFQICQSNAVINLSTIRFQKNCRYLQ
jgi:hypothetical protein